MRTKALLCAAAVAAGAVTAMAQSNVYSLNVVGYVNIPLLSGFNMIANPLDLDGTGTNNTVDTVFGTNMPNSTQVFPFSGGAFGANAIYNSSKAKWLGNTAGVNAALKVGGGVFVSVASPTTLTVVGNVLQGNLAINYPSGFSIVSSPIPMTGGMSSNLGYVPANSDIVYTWSAATQAYLPNGIYNSSKAKWLGSGEPQFTFVGESKFLSSALGGIWQTNFNVQ